MRTTKRLLAAILCIALLLPLLSVKTAEAAGAPEIRFDLDNLGPYDMVYYGTYNDGTVRRLAWTVLHAGLQGTETTMETFPMLSAYLLGNSNFRSDYLGDYDGGSLDLKMDEIYSGFTAMEQAAIVDTQLGHEPGDTQRKLFPLSREEVEDDCWGSAWSEWQKRVWRAPYISDPDGRTTNTWWTRSWPWRSMAYAWSANGIINRDVSADFGVRPAFHLRKSDFLFLSAA